MTSRHPLAKSNIQAATYSVLSCKCLLEIRMFDGLLDGGAVASLDWASGEGTPWFWAGSKQDLFPVAGKIPVSLSNASWGIWILKRSAHSCWTLALPEQVSSLSPCSGPHMNPMVAKHLSFIFQVSVLRWKASWEAVREPLGRQNFPYLNLGGGHMSESICKNIYWALYLRSVHFISYTIHANIFKQKNKEK